MAGLKERHPDLSAEERQHMRGLYASVHAKNYSFDAAIARLSSLLVMRREHITAQIRRAQEAYRVN
jgi:hypothetical protein